MSEAPIMDNFSEPYQIELKKEYSYSDTYSVDTENSDSIEVQEILDPVLSPT
jgi:hypothetical protein